MACLWGCPVRNCTHPTCIYVHTCAHAHTQTHAHTHTHTQMHITRWTVAIHTLAAKAAPTHVHTHTHTHTQKHILTHQKHTRFQVVRGILTLAAKAAPTHVHTHTHTQKHILHTKNSHNFRWCVASLLWPLKLHPPAAEPHPLLSAGVGVVPLGQASRQGQAVTRAWWPTSAV